MTWSISGSGSGDKATVKKVLAEAKTFGEAVYNLGATSLSFSDGDSSTNLLSEPAPEAPDEDDDDEAT